MLKPKRPRTWIVVADGARARFFEPSDDGKKFVAGRQADMVSPESRGHARDLKSDKPGRGYAAAGANARHAFEPVHDPHKLEKHKFSAALAEVLDSACGRRAFDRIILVAPRRSLGELRGLLSARVQRCIGKEVAKDLTNETAASLWRRLQTAVKPTL